MDTKRKGRRYVKEKSMRINLTIDKSNMDLVDLCCAKRNMNVSELFRTFAREYAVNVLKMNLNDFYYAKSVGKELKINDSKIENEDDPEYEQLKEEIRRKKEQEELERLKAERKARKVGASNTRIKCNTK